MVSTAGPKSWTSARSTAADYLFGVTGTKALAAKVEDVADPIRVERAKTGAAAVRGFATHTATRQSPGRSNVASSPVSRPHPWASISATSSPRFKPPAPRTSTPSSTAPAAELRWKLGDGMRKAA